MKPNQLKYLILSIFIQKSEGFREHDGNYIHWNMTESIFQPYKGASLQVKLGDYLDLICPSSTYKRSTSEPIHSFNLNLVDYTTFKSCSTERDQQTEKYKIKNRVIFKCNRPNKVKMFSTEIVQVSPFPNGLTFHPGKFYFLMTDDYKLCKEGLKMKLKVITGDNTNVVRLEQTPADNTEYENYEEPQVVTVNNPLIEETTTSSNQNSNTSLLTPTTTWLQENSLAILSGASIMFVIILCFTLCFCQKNCRQKNSQHSQHNTLNYTPNIQTFNQDHSASNNLLTNTGIKKINYLGSHLPQTLKNHNLNYLNAGVTEESPFYTYQPAQNPHKMMPKLSATVINGQTVQIIPNQVNPPVHAITVAQPQPAYTIKLPDLENSNLPRISPNNFNLSHNTITYQACFPDQNQNQNRSQSQPLTSSPTEPPQTHPPHLKKKSNSGHSNESKPSTGNNSNYSISSGYASAFRPYSKSSQSRNTCQTVENMSSVNNSTPNQSLNLEEAEKEGLVRNYYQQQQSNPQSEKANEVQQSHQTTSINILHYNQPWKQEDNVEKIEETRNDQFVVAI